MTCYEREWETGRVVEYYRADTGDAAIRKAELEALGCKVVDRCTVPFSFRDRTVVTMLVIWGFKHGMPQPVVE